MIKPVTFWQRSLVYLICWTFNIQPLLANVIVDNSQHNTSVNHTGNGVEVVNIATPNANGLSHNQYQQFNVDPSGLILNNSTQQVAQSQLGGYLQNNPNLHGQAATVILNEVTGASRSQLQGYTEVFGQGANVILTNPYGITCNGCGFINTPRVTLSTGNPLIDNGNVTGFDVSQGSVSIEGLGLDATHQSYFDIISRTAQLNAEIHANDLSIVTGKNRVSYQSNQVTATTPEDDKDTAPELAIDSSNLGGMYAGRIALVATDAGVGVNVGNLSASQGEIQISTDGQITLGKSSAHTNLTVSSQSDVTLKGSQYAGQTASLSGQSIHADSDTLAAGQNVSLTATDTVTLNQSLVEAGVDADGKQQAGGVIDVQANDLTLNAGNLIANQQLTTAVRHATVDQDSLMYSQDMTLNQLRKLDNRGTVAATHQLSVKGTDASLVGDGHMTASAITLESDRLTLDTHLTAQTLAVQADQALTTGEHSEVGAAEQLTVTAGTLNQQGQLTTRGDMNIDATDATLKGHVAAQNLHVKAQRLTQESGTLQAGQALDIAGGSVTLSGDSAAKTSVGIHADQLTLNGTLQSGGDTRLTVDGKMQTGDDSQLVTQGPLQVTVDGLTQHGQMQSGQDVTLTGQTLDIEGHVSAVGNSHLTAQNQLTNRGTVTSGQQLVIDGGAVTNSGELSAQQDTNVTVAGQLDNQANGLISGQVTTVQAGSVNNAGQLQALTDLGLTTDALNNSGTLVARHDATLNVTNHLTNHGMVSAAHDVRLLTDNLTNSGHLVASDNLLIAKDLNQTRTTTFNNTDGSLNAESGNLTIATQGDLQVSAGQHLFAGKNLTVTAATLNNGGEITAQDNTRLILDGVTTAHAGLTNQADALISGQTTSIDTQSVNNHGQLQALGSLGLTVSSLENSGTLTALNTTLSVHDQLSNTGMISAVRDTSLLASQVDNQGTVYAGEHLLVAADQQQNRSDSLNNAGRFETRNGDIDITADTVIQQNSGHIIAGHDLRLDGNQLDNGGELAATHQTNLTLDQHVLNRDTGLISGQATTLNAHTVDNQGQLQSLSDLGLTAESFENSGVLAAFDHVTLHITHDLTSRGSVLAGNHIVLNAGRIDNQGRVSAGDQAIVTAKQSATGSDAGLTVTADTLTNSGQLLAQGNNQLTLNTDLTNQTGGLISGQATVVKAQSVTNTGQLQSLSNLGLTTDALTNSGTLAALSDITLNVANRLSNSGAISASHNASLLTDNLTNKGRVFADNNLLIAKDSDQTRNTTFDNTDGSLTAKAGHLTIATYDDVSVSTGQHWVAGQNLTLQANSLTNDGEVSAQGNTALTLDNALTNHGLVSGQSLTVTTQSVTNTGQLQSLSDLGLTVNALDNSGTLAALSNITLNVANQLSNGGVISANHDASLLTDNLSNHGRVFAGNNLLIAKDTNQTRNRTFDNTDGSLTAKAGHLTVATHSNVMVSAGQHWVAGQDVTVHANSLTNNGEVSAQGNTALTLNDALTNHGLVSGQSTTVTTQSVTNSGQLQSLSDLGLTADALDNSGTLAALNDITLNVANRLSNSGAISANHNASLLTDNLTNKGRVFAGNNLLIAKDSNQTRNTTFDNTDGSLNAKAGHLTVATHANVLVSAGQHWIAGQDLTLQANSLTNHGEVSAQGNTALTLDNTLTNHGLISGQSTTVTTQSVTNNGQLQALTDLGLNADTLANTGALVAGRNAVFNIIHTLTSQGNISAGNNASLLADQVNNQNKIYAGNSVLIAKDSAQARSSSLINSGQIDAKHGSISIATQGDFTVGAGQHISAGKDLTLVAAALTNDGELSSQGTTNIGVDGTLTNYTAGIISGQNTVLRAGTTTNQGQLQGLNDLHLTTGTLTNTGSLVALNDMTVHATGHIDNHSLLYAGRNGNLFSDTLTNYSDIVVGNDLLIARDSNKTRSRNLTNSSGSIESLGGNIGIYADSVLNKRTVLNIVNQTQDLRGAIPGGGAQTIYIRKGSKYAPIVNVSSSHNDHISYTFYRIVGGTNWTFEAYRDQQVLQNASNASRILSGSDILIDTDDFQNNTSQVSGKNIFITANTLTNKGYEFQSYVTYFDYKIRNLHIRDVYPYDLQQIRRVDSGIIGTLQSSIIARDNLTLKVQNRTNNSVMGINAAGTQPTQSARTTRATQGPSGVQADVQTTQHIPNSGQGVASTQAISDSAQSLQTAQGAGTAQSVPVTQGASDTSGTVRAQSTPNMASMTRPVPQGGKSATTVTLSNSSAVTAPTLNLPNQNSIPFPDYRLPTSPHGLFVFSDGPQSDYLIATNPAVTNLNNFLGSDYFKDQLNYDPEQKEKFLGDAYYDTRTITQEIFEQTGKRYLSDDIGSDLAQMKQLIDSAAQQKNSLNLQNGVALTDEQIARLSHDIIWYEPIEVNGQTVMAPKLYLSSASQNNISNGALLAGRNIDIGTGDFANSGSVSAREDLQIASRGGISNTRGTLSANDDLALIATGDIVNRSGVISGDNVALLSTGGSIINETLSDQLNIDDQGNKVSSNVGNIRFTSTILDQPASIQSSGDLNLQAGGSYIGIGSRLSSGGDLNLSVANDILLTSQEDKTYSEYRDGKATIKKSEIGYLDNALSAGNNLNILTGGDMRAAGGSLSAGNNVSLGIGGDLLLSANETYFLDSYDASRKKDIISRTRQQGVQIQAGNDLQLTTDGDATLVAAGLSTQNNLTVSSGGTLMAVAGDETDYERHYRKRKGFWGSSVSDTEIQNTRAKGTSFSAGGSVNITSQDNQLHQASVLNAGQDITLRSTHGVLALKSAEESSFYRHDETKSGFMVKVSGEGKTSTTQKLTSMSSGGKITLAGALGMSVDYVSTGNNLARTLDQLPANGEYAWVAQLKDNPNVDWHAVNEAFDQWSYSDSHLSGPAAAMIAIAVAVVTAGSGAAAAAGNMAAGAAGSTAAAAGVSAATAASVASVAGAMGSAAFTSLVTQASIALVSNQGNLSSTFHDLGSSENMKSLATAVVSAGVMRGMDITQYANSGSVMDQVTQQVSRTAVQSGVSSAIQGGSFSDNFANGLKQAAVSYAGAEVADSVGDLGVGDVIDGVTLEDGSFTKSLLHGLTQGGITALSGGDFAAGAAGGFASEMTSDAIGHTSLNTEAQIKLSGLVGGIAGLIVTGDESGITAGQSAGEGVYANNYLNHNEAIRLDKELNSCQDPSSCQKVIDKYRALSDKNSQELQAACARHPITCTAHYQKLVSNGLDATEIPDWVPLNDSMSNEQAIEFVRAVNREDQEYINTHTSLADKVLPVVSNPEVQFELLTGAVIVKDLALAVSKGAKNLFGNAGKVVTSEASAAGEGTVLADGVLSTNDNEIILYRTQPKKESKIITGGAFAREREHGASVSEAHDVRQSLLNAIENPKTNTQLIRALENAQASGNKSPYISMSKDKKFVERRAQQITDVFGQEMEVITVKGPKDTGVDFNELFDNLGGRISPSRAKKDVEQQEVGIPDLFIPASGKSKSGFEIINRSDFKTE
ncbi:filamentous hemagglutinin N-terminal domain-containing protein [Vibrio gazogenes]|uniref:Filamentous haemagglutinin FhaB/tRNA nuclease CdiA-like TPS domain-containing protein n=1 Tax=Vibrio gazogenes TaxID=687 RepID=A0A1Z2SL50_VIBGA|nr:filamentous hemagglutinin N-terminal domain-containing protein [Vibrio gazogenes]ASA57933.1 hypothetical protein BSQ33_19685 [Vibrio gazogenes]